MADQSSTRCRPAVAPLANAGASYVAAVLAVAVIAAGGVCLRDTALRAGLITGDAWIPLAIKAFDGVAPSTYVLVVAVLLAVLGVLLIGIAVKPRRATAVAARTEDGGPVYVRLPDVARAAAAAAAGVAGVEHATGTATNRKVSLRCQSSAPNRAELRHLVTRAVRDELQTLARPPRITVRLGKETRS